MAKTSSELDYLIRPARSQSKKTAALILLHGYGSNKEDLFSFEHLLPKEYTVIALEAPLTLMPGSFAWYELRLSESMEKWTDVDQAKASIQRIRKQLRYLIETYDLEPSKISLIGFSQGAILSWCLGLDYPEEFQKIIALSGYIHSDLLQQPIANYKNIRAFASHGTKDPVLPVELPKSTVPELQKNNPLVTFKTYESEHTINQANFIDMLDWINQHP